MTALVVDASVAVKWLVPDAGEEDVAAANALLDDHYAGRVELAVPPLLFDEIGNVLVCGRARLALHGVDRAIEILYALPLRVGAREGESARSAARLARLHGLTYYDATYLALAESLGCPLVTADRRLAARAAGTGLVRRLGAATP